jgi:hypothetical protein
LVDPIAPIQFRHPDEPTSRCDSLRSVEIEGWDHLVDDLVAGDIRKGSAHETWLRSFCYQPVQTIYADSSENARYYLSSSLGQMLVIRVVVKTIDT